MSSSEEMVTAIRDFVVAERHRRGIHEVDTSWKPEPSGEAYGEFHTLLECQLLTTAFGHGGWHELSTTEVLEGVFREVQARRSV